MTALKASLTLLASTMPINDRLITGQSPVAAASSSAWPSAILQSRLVRYSPKAPLLYSCRPGIVCNANKAVDGISGERQAFDFFRSVTRPIKVEDKPSTLLVTVKGRAWLGNTNRVKAQQQ